MPNEFQKVEWIGRQSGTVSISTGYYFTTNSDMRIVYLMPSTSGNMFYWYSGGSSSGAHQSSNSQVKLTHGRTDYYLNLPYNNKYDLKIGKNGVWEKDALLLNEDMSLNSPSPTELMSYQTRWSGDIHIFLCQFYENSNLVMDLIPCYRKTDNEIGLYDLVNDKFYTNQGTGTLMKGPEV